MKPITLYRDIKPQYFMGVDSFNGIASFVVIRKDGEIMEYGTGRDDNTFKLEVKRAAKRYNIKPSEILKEVN